MRTPFSICANPDCESVILSGQRVWRKGNDQYCHSRCLITSFGGKPEVLRILREKEIPKISTKQERIDMMRDVYAKRRKKIVDRL